MLEDDSGLPDFFLARLAALMVRQAATVNPTRRLVPGVAAFSTFLDCPDLGLAMRVCANIEHFRDEADSGA